MASRSKDSGKRNRSTSDSSLENIPNTISASKEKKSSIKPDAKKNRQVTCKDKDDQTSITQFTKTQISTEKPDLQSIVSQLALITENMITKEDLKQQIEGAKNDIVSCINERMDKLELRIFTLEVQNEKLEKENKRLQGKCSKLESDVSSAVFSSNLALTKLNDLEQYTRKSSIRIFGVSDKNKNETAEQSIDETMGVLNKIGAKITKQNIVIAHRVGRFEDKKTRPIIVKFVSNIHKREAIFHRRKLRGTGLGISEDLTAKNMQYLNKLQEHETVAAAWTKDTKFYVKLKGNDKIMRVEPAVFLHDEMDDSDTDRDE